MAKRATRRRPAARTGADQSMSCPCGLGTAYEQCCGAAHAGRPPATAEALMRSRYSAFALDNADYVLSSWHPTTRPAGIEPDAQLRWLRLEILESTGGGLFDNEGLVEFKAHFRDHGQAGEMRERSRFVRHDGRWVYWGPILADGTLADI